MRENDLPTRGEILRNAQAELDRAYQALGDAADWLRSDWRPFGTLLTAQQARQRSRMSDAITRAKDAINRAR
jgi:hypothetical protein